MSTDGKKAKTVVLKICLLGDGAVGKTSLRTRYLGEGFTTQYSETIGADFALKFAKLDDLLIKHQIWDIAGQPRYTQVRSILFDRSDGGLLLFDLSNRDSLTSVENWIKTYVQYAGVGAVILIGNKSDLRDGNEVSGLVTKEEGEEMAKNLGEKYNRHIPYLETSAKSGENVDKAFDILAQTYFKLSNKSLSGND
ncbi:MAG: GTPase KRas precursor [Candidatus Heimdallarchaeota archaeon LC_3]|nr:MAG: GTPase KRas precursor [Candidatus Heimdallarchaeota archaeon LC_3]